MVGTNLDKGVENQSEIPAGPAYTFIEQEQTLFNDLRQGSTKKENFIESLH